MSRKTRPRKVWRKTHFAGGKTAWQICFGEIQIEIAGERRLHETFGEKLKGKTATRNSWRTPQIAGTEHINQVSRKPRGVDQHRLASIGDEEPDSGAKGFRRTPPPNSSQGRGMDGVCWFLYPLRRYFTAPFKSLKSINMRVDQYFVRPPNDHG